MKKIVETETPAMRKLMGHERRREAKSGKSVMPKHGKSVFVLWRIRMERAERARKARSLKGAKK